MTKNIAIYELIELRPEGDFTSLSLSNRRKEILCLYAEEFEKWLKSEGLTPETIRNFVSQFNEFSMFCDNRNITINELSVGVAREYMIWLAERPNYHNGEPLSAATRVKHYYCLRRIGEFLNERGLFKGSLIEGIRRPIRRQTVIYGFSADQLQAIINATRNLRTTPQYKDRMGLLVFTLASTGLRISEALQLRPNSFDHNRRSVTVLGKGNKEREVPFSQELSKLIIDYIKNYEIEREGLLFASRYGKPLAPSTIRDALRKAKKSLGTHLDIDRMRVSPHTFRHTFARMWVVKGGNTIALSRIMGHTSTAMTSKYVSLWGLDLNQSYDMTNPCGDIEYPKFD